MRVIKVLHYIARAGDTFDKIADKFYDSEFMDCYIYPYNDNIADVIVFNGGEDIRVPIFDNIINDTTLAPWRQSNA